MAINKERLAKVQEYGLTEYEARAYLALLDLEVATASKVARLSRVPRTKIYQALEGLETKKLVRVIPERPKRFVAQPFINYMNQLERDLKREAEQLASKKEDVAAEFMPKGTAELEEPGQFVMVRSRANVTEKLMGLIERADESILVLGSEMALHRFDYFTPALEQAQEKGVLFTAIGPVTEANSQAVEALSELGRILEYPKAKSGHCLVIVDGEEALLIHAVPDDTHLFQGEDVALWTDDMAMVSSFEATVELTLSAAEALDGQVPQDAEPVAQVA